MIRFIDCGQEHIDYVKKAKIRYIFKTVEDMWVDLKAMFKEKWVRFIPVFNVHGELLCLAYEKYWKRTAYIEYLDKCLCSAKGKYFHNFLKEFCSELDVQIYGFNESAWRLYKLFKKNDIIVRVSGARWKQFCPEAIFFAPGNVEKKIWKIDVEEKKCENPPDDERLMYLELAYSLMILKKWKSFLKERGILFQSILIPDIDVSQLTSNEKYRLLNNIEPYSMRQSQWEDKEVQKHMPEYERGKPISWAEWKKMEATRQRNEVEINGKRVVYLEYGTGTRRVYLFGPCIVRGMYVSDEDSLGNCIYRAWSKKLSDFKIICLSPTNGSLVFFEDLIEKVLLRKGDVVLWFSDSVSKPIDEMGYGCEKDVDLYPVFSGRNMDFFWNAPIHTTPIGNRCIAEECVKEIFANHLEYFKANAIKNELVQTGQILLSPGGEEEIRVYIREIKETIPGFVFGRCIGAVVMNCNPMTIGHLYMIKQAVEMVDYLYLFVVEEDKSEITFRDRMEMVQRAVCNMKNVFVFPSGRFIISYSTMPIYFEKESRQEDIWDASSDLQIFCEKIAPALGITVRFMGEEPKDKITKQYNDMMRELAPLYGISFIEIPRLIYKGEIVSATNVRKYLKEGKVDLVQMLTPKENWEILQKYVEYRNWK